MAEEKKGNAPEKKPLMGFKFTVLDDGSYDMLHMGVNNDLELLALVEVAKTAVTTNVIRQVTTRVEPIPRGADNNGTPLPGGVKADDAK